MEAIRQWAAGVCFAAGAAGLCKLLSPESSLGRMLQMSLSVFFLSSILLPLSFSDISLSMPKIEQSQQKAEEISQQAQEQTASIAYDAAEQIMQQEIKNFLLEEGITPVWSRIDIIQKDSFLQVFLELCLEEKDRTKEEWIAQNLSSEHLSLKVYYQEGEDSYGANNTEGKTNSNPVD